MPLHTQLTYRMMLTLAIESSRSQNRRQDNKFKAMIEDNTGMVCSIDPSELGKSYDGPIRLTDYRFLASYNWSKAEEPTIFIPG